MSNNSAWFNVLGIDWKSVDPESAETFGAGTSSPLRSWSKLAGPAARLCWLVIHRRFGHCWDGTGRFSIPCWCGIHCRDRTTQQPLPGQYPLLGRDGTDHPPLLVRHPLPGRPPVTGRHLLDQAKVLGWQTMPGRGNSLVPHWMHSVRLLWYVSLAYFCCYCWET